MSTKDVSENLKKCLKAYYHRETNGTFYPVYYGLEVSRWCNFSCIMCPNSRYKPQDKGDMSWGLFCKIIDGIAQHAEIIKLHWMGEPLHNPRIIDMLHYARSATEAKLYMSTNASLLSGELIESVRTSGLDKIIFSVDGATPTTYENIRVNGDFHQVIHNIETFVEAVESKGGPVCEIKMIQFYENEDEIAKFREKWSQYNSTIVNVMWLSNWAGQMPSLLLKSGSMCPYTAEERTACSDIWFKMQIDWRGEVHLCCYDWSGELTLGNLSTDTVLDVWHGEVIRSVRRKHIDGRYFGICKSCNEWVKVQEYEFWYSDKELREDPSRIWYSSDIPAIDISPTLPD